VARPFRPYNCGRNCASRLQAKKAHIHAKTTARQCFALSTLPNKARLSNLVSYLSFLVQLINSPHHTFGMCELDVFVTYHTAVDDALNPAVHHVVTWAATPRAENVGRLDTDSASASEPVVGKYGGFAAAVAYAGYADHAIAVSGFAA
jgi:hypothetical protein